MKYTREKIEEAVKISKSITEVCRNLGLDYASGSMQTHISKKIKQYEFDTSHFLGKGWNKGVVPANKRSAEEILCKKSSGAREKADSLRRALREIGRTYECENENCGNNGFWLGEPITLEVHHRDGHQ